MKVYIVIDGDCGNAVLNVYRTRAAARAFIKILREESHWELTRGRFYIRREDLRE